MRARFTFGGLAAAAVIASVLTVNEARTPGSTAANTATVVNVADAGISGGVSLANAGVAGAGQLASTAGGAVGGAGAGAAAGSSGAGSPCAVLVPQSDGTFACKGG